jgi:hypothetical protein
MDAGAVALIWVGSLGLGVTALEFGKEAIKRYRNGDGNRTTVIWQTEVTALLKKIEEHTKVSAKSLDHQGHTLETMAQALESHAAAAEDHHKEMHDFSRDLTRSE